MAILLVLWAIGAGYVVSRWERAASRPLIPLAMGGEWITSPDSAAYSAYFRHTIHLPGRVKHAWVAVSPDNSFELAVNGNPVGRFYLWRPTRPYQTGLSDHGQRLVSPSPALGLNFPREYQWSDHDNGRLPVWIDIGPTLRPGQNVLSVQVEARHAAPAFRMFGSVEMWSGEVIPIESSREWRAEPIPPGIQSLDWTHPNYLDGQWRYAVLSSARHSTPMRAFDDRVFRRPFAGNRIFPNRAVSDSATWFQAEWELPATVRDGCFRILTNRAFDVYINGHRLGAATPSPVNLDGGNWLINDRGSWDDFRRPEVVDPDEIGSLFVGDDFLSPRHADPTFDPVATYRNQINVTTDKPRETDRSDLPGTYDPKRDLEETRRLPDKPESYPEGVPPRSVERDRGVSALYGYDVTRLLRRGKNIIQVRLAESQTFSPPNWSPSIAVHAFATTIDGEERVLISDDSWLSVSGANWPDHEISDPVQVGGSAANVASSLPRLTFRGVQISYGAEWRSWAIATIAAGGSIALMIGAGWVLLGRSNSRRRLRSHWLYGWSVILLIAASLIGCVAILEVSFAERDEALWGMEVWPWATTAIGVSLVILLGGVYLVHSLVHHHPASVRGESSLTRLRSFASGRWWNLLVAVVLIGSTVLRAYALDLQPMDDDEYASVQAVIAIARSGAPDFVPEGVAYTRSPAFHYLAALPVYLFGENVWALRLPSVLLGVGTVWMTYIVGVKLLRSPLVGFATMLLMAVHPFEIFTSHVARFYQQQQFCALVTVYWFCKGFITDQSQRYRYLSVVGLLVTVLSQEIAIVMVPLFAIGFLLFGRDLGWKANLRLGIAIVIALGWIFIDWVAFQTLCLTRTEGVSPNFEATVKPHFWQPFNVLSLFIGYSRLHLSLSLFIAFDLFLGWRSRRREYLGLFVLLIAGVVLANLLVTHSSLRYLYYLFPLWALLGVDAIRHCAGRLSRYASGPARVSSSALTAGLATLFFVTVILSWSPWRIPGSYSLRLLPDSTGACRFVAGQIRPGDKVMITEPHPHAAYLEIGRVDYDLSVPILLDFVVLQNGKLLDRNAGAEAVGGLTQLQRVLESNDRVWILINKEKFRTRGKNVRWEYPAARIEEYLRRNTEMKYRSNLWYVYLWDVSAGRFRHFATD